MAAGQLCIDESEVRQGQPDPVHLFYGDLAFKVFADLFSDFLMDIIENKYAWRQTKEENKYYNEEKYVPGDSFHMVQGSACRAC